jgi:hypothetical protein
MEDNWSRKYLAMVYNFYYYWDIKNESMSYSFKFFISKVHSFLISICAHIAILIYEFYIIKFI